MDEYRLYEEIATLRARQEELERRLTVYSDNIDISVEQTPGGQIIKSLVDQPAEQETAGLDPFYFNSSKQTNTTVRISTIRFRYGKNMGTSANITGYSPFNDYIDVTIPTTNGVYWVHFMAEYDTSYTFSFQPGTVDTHPDQSDIDTSTRAWREEVCKVTVASNVISTVEQIWAGGIISIEGRVV